MKKPLISPCFEFEQCPSGDKIDCYLTFRYYKYVTYQLHKKTSEYYRRKAFLKARKDLLRSIMVEFNKQANAIHFDIVPNAELQGESLFKLLDGYEKIGKK